MKKILRKILIIICLWVAITSIIQAFIKPSMTEMERFLSIPNSFILKFAH